MKEKFQLIMKALKGK